MDFHILSGVGRTTGLSAGLAYDPDAVPSECWVVTIGGRIRGLGMTPEGALDAALREVTTEDLRTEQARNALAS
jgi:hypothetical protein